MKKGLLGALALAGVVVAAARFVEFEFVDELEGGVDPKEEAAFVRGVHDKVLPVLRDPSTPLLEVGAVMSKVMRALGRNVDVVSIGDSKASVMTLKGPKGAYVMTLTVFNEDDLDVREVRLSLKGFGRLDGFALERGPMDPNPAVSPSDFVGKARRSQAELLAEAVLASFASNA